MKRMRKKGSGGEGGGGKEEAKREGRREGVRGRRIGEGRKINNEGLGVIKITGSGVSEAPGGSKERGREKCIEEISSVEGGGVASQLRHYERDREEKDDKLRKKEEKVSKKAQEILYEVEEQG